MTLEGENTAHITDVRTYVKIRHRLSDFKLQTIERYIHLNSCYLFRMYDRYNAKLCAVTSERVNIMHIIELRADVTAQSTLNRAKSISTSHSTTLAFLAARTYLVALHLSSLKVHWRIKSSIWCPYSAISLSSKINTSARSLKSGVELNERKVFQSGGFWPLTRWKPRFLYTFSSK